MPRRVAVIDIGSNSARMAIFERTSRFGFFILREVKSKVRISEGAYEHQGFLQPEAMKRASLALNEFVHIAKSVKVSKILCVATSALRDAPNRSEFISHVRRYCGLNIRVIDGHTEAKMGAIAALNLLPITNGITVDIGGGSTECALICNKKIIDVISLDIGTVRLKELFFDTGLGAKKAIDYIRKQLQDNLPPLFKSDILIGIGGTNRAIATAIMSLENYPLETLHAYTYSIKKYLSFFDKLIEGDNDKLSHYKIKPERFDVIRQGALIMRELFTFTQSSTVMTSGVGVREGVFLYDLLRSQGGRFPENFNPSLRVLLDRFELDDKETRYYSSMSLKLFDVLSDLHQINQLYKKHLGIIAKLSNIGASLNYYNKSSQGYALIINNLNFGLTHTDKVIIAASIKYIKKKLPKKPIEHEIETLKISIELIRWLSFIISVVHLLSSGGNYPPCEFIFEDKKLILITPPLYLAKEKLKEIYIPKGIEIVMKENV